MRIAAERVCKSLKSWLYCQTAPWVLAAERLNALALKDGPVVPLESMGRMFVDSKPKVQRTLDQLSLDEEHIYRWPTAFFVLTLQNQTH